MADGNEARFEFRVWGPQCDAVADAIRGRSAPIDEISSTETYLVSARTVEVNPKVRDGKLDVKALVGVTAGFEQWEVSLKADLPVSKEVVAESLLAPFGLTPARLDLPQYSLDQILTEIVETEPDLAAAFVSKHRVLFELAGYSAEISDVAIEGDRQQTVAIESTDLDTLVEARRSLGLAGSENVSYPRAIRATLGGRFAVR